jgi:L-Ala-D/L-Glu epimerase
MIIKSLHFREIVRPMKITFSTSLGQKDQIRSVIITVTLADGTTGAGECPTSFVLKEETPPKIKTILKEASRRITGTPVGSYGETVAALRRIYPRNPMTVSGLEVALFRAYLAERGIKEQTYWGGHMDRLETDITIPFLPDMEKLDRWIDFVLRTGFGVFKVKVSGNVAEDSRFISSFHERLKGSLAAFTIRLDGNQGYTPSTFMHMVDHLDRAGIAIELFEQPLPKDDYRGLQDIAGRSPIPIILDETVFTAEDARKAAENGLGQGINIKVAKSGIAGSRGILEVAQKHGLRLMIGCMTETMTGLSAGIQIAAGTGAFDYIDLDSIYFLHHRKNYGTIRITGPEFLIGK